ncbi:MAG: hypothetical protein HOP11_00205 [Saprospiraceae bacterium]|nr:hypothetical protein [Saprospiraceae bacterium]
MKVIVCKTTVLTIFSLCLLLSLGCEEENPATFYLRKWIGVYDGTSRHWSTYPSVVNGNWQIITNESNRKVTVDVGIGVQDSALNFKITYNDSITSISENLLFSNEGVHFAQTGGGSGYGSVNIRFVADSLYYSLFQKCGIPCSSGIDFKIKKI